MKPGEEITHSLESKRHVWVQVARGKVRLNGKELPAGDGAAISDETELVFHTKESSEVLLFDLA